MLKENSIRELPTILDQLSGLDSTATLASRFQSAQPFPHLVFENLFNPEQLEAVLNEGLVRGKSEWVYHNTQNIAKLGQKSAATLGEAGYELVSLLHSAPFLYLLSEITGIWNLLPDPYMHGAGYSIIPSEAKFDVHLDANADTTTGLTRRLALLIYLNHDWSPEYGGQLELWGSGDSSQNVVVTPDFNTTVLMEISDRALHGINPVREPHGRSRVSFMAYYNTSGPILSKEMGVHGSLYAPVCYKQKPTLQQILRRWVPPAIFDYLHERNHKH
jgi:hypothetical protein